MPRPAKSSAASKPAPQSAKITDRLRQANIANIIKRLNAGKTLTRVEQQALTDHEASAGETPPHRLRKKALALELGISRVTLDQYLNRTHPKPPQADADQTYSVEETAAYIAENGFRSVTTQEMGKLRESILRIQLAREEIELAVLRKLYVEKNLFEPTIVTVMTLLTDNMTKEFVLALPSGYEGKATAERAKMNEDAVARVLQQFKSGLAGIR